MKLPARMVFRYARRVLSERMSAADARRVLRDAERDCSQRSQDLPREDALGGRVFLEMAAACAGLFHAMCKAGSTEDEACAQVGEIMRRLYDAALKPSAALSRRAWPDGKRRLSVVIDVSRKYFFPAPAWRTQTVFGADNQACFDIHRCPLADYLVPQGLSALCKAAFCDGDELMAEQLGVKLARTGLLSTGAEKCDFRWSVQAER